MECYPKLNLETVALIFGQNRLAESEDRVQDNDNTSDQLRDHPHVFR